MSKIIPNFSVIIPNYNADKILPQCLNNLKTAIQNCPNSKFEIILVDNNSSDQSIKIFQQLLNKYQHSIISLTSNFGFASAANRGIKQSRYSYICLLNNDITLDKFWFKYISESIVNNDSKVSTYCGTIIDPKTQEIESRGLNFHISGQAIQNKQFKKNIWGSSAAAVVYSKKIINKIGLFDDKFFAYIEDVDLSFRLHQKAYKTLCHPHAIAYHLGGYTSNKMSNLRQYYTTRNWWYLILKNYSKSQIQKNLIPILLERLHNYLWFLRSTHPIFWIPQSVKLIFQIVNYKFLLKSNHQ